MKAIAYTRVSTSEQGKSGLGLDAQQSDIQSFCETNNIELIDTVQEVASAKGAYRNRPVLNALLTRCKRERCCLMVSKLDRLSRDVESIANLVNDKSIRFIVVQLGLEADNFQIHLFASLAQKKRDWISQRTKVALKAKR
jgi:DNA invertase Pin-like site-specific DNA recombinase